MAHPTAPLTPFTPPMNPEHVFLSARKRLFDACAALQDSPELDAGTRAFLRVTSKFLASLHVDPFISTSVFVSEAAVATAAMNVKEFVEEYHKGVPDCRVLDNLHAAAQHTLAELQRVV